MGVGGRAFKVFSWYILRVHRHLLIGVDDLGIVIDLNEKLRLARSERYACQSVARKALPSERVRICLRSRNGDYVSVHRHNKTNTSFFGGLMVCGSVWTCPVCAAKISEKRREEIKTAFDMHTSNSGFISMLTLTFSHQFNDRLEDILKKFGQATQKFMSGKAYQNLRNEMGLIGRIRVFEVTYGDNGFHPHAHIALFYTKFVDLQFMREKMYALWEKACSKFELKTSYDYGLDLQSAEDADDYISKHGTWSLEQELSKSHIKKAKNGSLSPFDFLRIYLQNEDEKYLCLFREYAKCFKGKRQIQWSQGLKNRFILEDKSDEELAKEKIEEADLLGLLDYDQWKQVLKYDLRATLLDNIEKNGFELGLELTLIKKRQGKSPSLV